MKVLILGCGEVGRTCAKLLLINCKPKKLTLHCKSLQRKNALRQEFSHEKGVDITNLDIFSQEGIDSLSSMIQKLQPDYIIDCLPVGNILVGISKNESVENASSLLFAYISCLKDAFDHGVKRIQKVSSGGAGGLGISCPYRHGLSTSSSADLLLWKIYFNGALHQLLINLHESAKASVGLTIPRALIGYELTDQAHIIGCGDGTLYTRTELELCANPTQFGFTTKEEVAKATLKSLFSEDLKNDHVYQACLAGINQSKESAQLLNDLTSEMARAEQAKNIKIVSVGALGNQVTKDMIELLLAIELHNGNYSTGVEPKEFLLTQCYFEPKVLDHFNFHDTPVLDDRNIDYSNQNLTDWHMLVQKCTATSQLKVSDVGNYLAAVYQQQGIEKK